MAYENILFEISNIEQGISNRRSDGNSTLAKSGCLRKVVE